MKEYLIVMILALLGIIQSLAQENGYDRRSRCWRLSCLLPFSYLHTDATRHWRLIICCLTEHPSCNKHLFTSRLY